MLQGFGNKYNNSQLHIILAPHQVAQNVWACFVAATRVPVQQIKSKVASLENENVKTFDSTDVRKEIAVIVFLNLLQEAQMQRHPWGLSVLNKISKESWGPLYRK